MCGFRAESSTRGSSRANERGARLVSDLVIFVVIVPLILVAGIGLGMLVARRLNRLGDDDEEPGDD
jgi:hypothetical protein